MMERKTQGQSLTRLLILTLITLFVWIGFSVYGIVSKKTLPELSESQIKPFNPQLDLKIIDQLKNKVSPGEEDFAKIPSARQQTLTKEASPSAKPKENL